MTAAAPLIRPAKLEEAEEIAALSRTSRAHFLPYLPQLHTPEEDKAFFRNSVFSECEIWVAEDGGQIVGFCAFKGDWLAHLYLRPSHVGRSIGTQLLGKAKDRHHTLKLWVFQQNLPAIRFYVRHGFRKITETDGASNEERAPDAMYQWNRCR